ncbi:MAG: ribbon-helix-helix domain-containing protein [Pseudomonadota bacterium]
MAANKPNPLAAALNEVPAEPVKPAAAKPAATRSRKAPAKKARARDNTVMIGGHFPKSVKQQLSIIAAEEDTTKQALLEEALNLLFVKKGKEQIA